MLATGGSLSWAVDTVKEAGGTDIRAIVMGPTDEDPAYYEECRALVDELGLKEIVSFCEKTASTFVDVIMDTALQCVGLSKNNLCLKTES